MTRCTSSFRVWSRNLYSSEGLSRGAIPVERLRCSQPRWVRMCLQFRKSLLAVHCGYTWGTGWIAASGDGFVVATPNHVIEEAVSNNQPIRLHHTDSDAWIEFELKPDSLIQNEKLDLAVFSVPSSSPGPSLRQRSYLNGPTTWRGKGTVPTHHSLIYDSLLASLVLGFPRASRTSLRHVSHRMTSLCRGIRRKSQVV